MGGANLAHPAQQGRAPFDTPDELVSCGVLESSGQGLRCDPRQRSGVGPPWLAGIGGKKPCLHSAQARHREALGTREDLAGLRLLKAPASTSPGIDEDRDDGEIDPRSSRLVRVGPGRDQRRAVDPSGREMPPSAVVGDVEIGIAPPRDFDDAADRLLKTRDNEPKMPGLAALGSGKDYAAAVSDGRRGQQFRRVVSRRAHDP